MVAPLIGMAAKAAGPPLARMAMRKIKEKRAAAQVAPAPAAAPAPLNSNLSHQQFQAAQGLWPDGHQPASSTPAPPPPPSGGLWP